MINLKSKHNVTWSLFSTTYARYLVLHNIRVSYFLYFYEHDAHSANVTTDANDHLDHHLHQSSTGWVNISLVIKFKYCGNFIVALFSPSDSQLEESKLITGEISAWVEYPYLGQGHLFKVNP